MNKIIVFLLALLGFSLASKQSAAQYGVMIQMFEVNQEIKGMVVNDENKPIPYVNVISNNDTVTTNHFGYFNLKQTKYHYAQSNYPLYDSSAYKIQFRDIYFKEEHFNPKDTIIFVDTKTLKYSMGVIKLEEKDK